MSALAFDTLSASRILTTSGLSQKQAEAVTKVVKSAQDAHFENLVTKGDIQRLETKLVAKIDGDIQRLESKADGDIQRLEAKIETDILRLENKMDKEFAELRGDMRLMKWMLAAIIAAQVLPLLKTFFGAG